MSKDREIRGRTYTLVLLRITDWDAAGRPSRCEVAYDDAVIDLGDDSRSREFMTAYVPKHMTAPQRRGH